MYFRPCCGDPSHSPSWRPGVKILPCFPLMRRSGDDPSFKTWPNKLKYLQLEQFQCRCIVDSGETLRQTGNGEIVWGRSAAQAAAGPRPWGRNTRATGGALLGERAVGMEDLRPA